MAAFPSNLFLWIPLGAFITAALVGVALLAAHTRERRVSLPPAVLHGVVALVGLGALTYAVLRAPGAYGPWAPVVLGLMLLVALGGVVLLVFHVLYGRIPISAAGAHGAGALIGVALLAAFLLARAQTGHHPVPTVAPETTRTVSSVD